MLCYDVAGSVLRRTRGVGEDMNMLSRRLMHVQHICVFESLSVSRPSPLGKTTSSKVLYVILA